MGMESVKSSTVIVPTEVSRVAVGFAIVISHDLLKPHLSDKGQRLQIGLRRVPMVLRVRRGS